MEENVIFIEKTGHNAPSEVRARHSKEALTPTATKIIISSESPKKK